MNKFLVITSFYNNTKKHVEQTFQNVLNQTYQEWVLIVGDDFSDDPEFKTYLKNRVISLNDPRIIYYDIKFKRELYLYQNFFKEYDYDYFFHLDSDDIIHKNIFKIYDNHFQKYPNVNSIYSDFNKTDEDHNLQMLSLIQPPSNYTEDFNLRTKEDFSTIYAQRSGQHMYGVARCMRRPVEDKMHTIKNCKSSNDTMFLFFNLSKGDHLNIPRQLYTYLKREKSDSGVLTTEEYKDFNTNAHYYIKNCPLNSASSFNPYKKIWFETSAISSCNWLDSVDEFCLITNPNINLDLLKFLYPDKRIILNDFDHKNQIVVWDKLNSNIKANLNLNSTYNCTIFYSNENFSIPPESVVEQFNISSNKFISEVNSYLKDYSYYNYFRQCVVTRINPPPKPKLLVIQPHLSTGGCPQYLLDYLTTFKDTYSEVKVVEVTNFSYEFVIQKNKLISLIGKDNLITLGEFGCSDKQWYKDKKKLLKIINKYNPDTIWMNETPEGFEYRKIPKEILDKIYVSNRKYKIIETTHYNAFNFQEKKYIPDEFMFCSPKHIKDSEHIDIPKKVWEVPIEKKIRPNREQTLIKLGLDPTKFHVLNVGLFNDNKNQKYIFDIAEQTKDLPIQYHFIGNTCFINECKINNYQQNLSNCKLWGERNDVDKFMSCMDLYFFPSKKELNPLTVKEALSWDIPVLANYDSNYTNQYKDFSQFYLIQNISFKKFIKQNFNINSLKINEKNKITVNFFGSPKVSIDGSYSSKYLVKFIDNKTKKLIWEDTISNNMWTSPNLKYYIKWEIEIWESGKLIHSEILNYKDQKVLINFESKSIGDTIAWFPYIQKFQEIHNCNVVVSTFHNEWFQSQYPDLNFVPPGVVVDGIQGIYDIGWFYTKDQKIDYSSHPIDFKSQPLQKTATDILGLEYKEVKPKINFKPTTSPIKGKYVTLSMQSTAQSKYWNHPTGWQEVVNFLTTQGYQIVLVDQHKTFGTKKTINHSPTNVIDKTQLPLSKIMPLINKAEFHLGISSGLSWVAWALNTPVVMVSSFTKPWCEFQNNCTRIYNETPTSGYFNTHKLDASNWNWYPFKKMSTLEDWYEVETITPEQVINKIKQIL